MVVSARDNQLELSLTSILQQSAAGRRPVEQSFADRNALGRRDGLHQPIQVDPFRFMELPVGSGARPRSVLGGPQGCTTAKPRDA
jgi:hypothetical protein